MRTRPRRESLALRPPRKKRRTEDGLDRTLDGWKRGRLPSCEVPEKMMVLRAPQKASDAPRLPEAQSRGLMQVTVIGEDGEVQLKNVAEDPSQVSVLEWRS